MTEVDRAIARHLDTQGLVTYSESTPTGIDCFLGRMPPSPDAAVGIFLNGGNRVEGGFGMGYDEPVVQVQVRGAAYDVLGPKNLAQSIYDELHGMTATTLDPAGLAVEVVRIVGVQSAPVGLGLDENERHQFSINLACYVRAASIVYRT